MLKESAETSQDTMHRYHQISACLGWLGAVNSLLIGFYILTTSISLHTLGIPHTEHLLQQAYVTIVLTLILTLILAINNYYVWKRHAKRLSVINLATGTTLIVVYLYFEFMSNPTLLSWLRPWGYFLLAPAVVAAAIGITVLG